MKKIGFDTGHFEGWRFLLIYAAIAVVFVYYLFRLFSLQITNASVFITQAFENRREKVNTAAMRGTIYDRNGFVLARNAPSYSVVITPADLPGYVNDLEETVPGPVQEIYRQLSELTGVPVNAGTINEETVKNFSPCNTDFGITQIVYIAVTNWPYKPTKIKCNIDAKLAMEIQEKAADWPGVGIQVDPIREYPTGSLTSEVIGFLGPLPAGESDNPVFRDANLVEQRDKVGYAGIEMEFQQELSGVNGLQDIETDVSGKQVGILGPATPPVDGNNIQLTIDTRLQSAAKSAIKKELDYWNAISPTTMSQNAVVIAVNPKTGEILAYANYPTYENNRMARVIPTDYYEQLIHDPTKPLFNQGISAELPPGSVFKMATALGILNEGVVTPDEQFNDPGLITIKQQFYDRDIGLSKNYVCWKRDGHGLVDYIHAIAFSCDVYFYKVGGGFEDEVPNGGLGIYRIGEYARALGYGQPTGIELPGEESGLIPDPKWKRLIKMENWSTGDTYINTIGQGFVQATPLQVLMSIAAIANDGKMMQPTLIKEIDDSEGHVVEPFTPKLRWDITRDPLVGVYDSNNQPVYLRDANGNPIPELDEDGQPVLDQWGDPVYQMERKTVAPWVINLAKEGMRLVVTEGTIKETYPDFDIGLNSAGKTGTAEYCDDIANAQRLCEDPENWPAHAWYVGYAPYDNPEIAVVAFVYHGQEGSRVAAPIVREVLNAYFQLKKVDASGGVSSTSP